MRLLNATSVEEIETIFSDCEKRSKAIIHQLAQICWYMRGGVNWDQAKNMCIQDRNQMFDLINENIQRVKETKMPLL